MSVAQPSPPTPHKRRAFYGLPFVSWVIYRLTWWFVYGVDRVFFRTRTRGLEAFPDTGPVLLLSNHVGMLDPFQVALHPYRPSRFMAATSIFKIPLIGPWMRALGAFPKMKYVKDRDSMRTLASHYDAGHVVTLFPEGVRTWTGEPMPILPGIGRLIKRLDARVMFGRIESGYLFHPRWARYPRYVPLEISYQGPFHYPGELTAEEIAEDVRQRLDIRPSRDKRRFAWGFRLAEGLPDLLWACPACMEADALEVPRADRDTVRCSHCSATWRVDIDTVLNGIGDAPTLTVHEAHEAIEAHFGSPAVLDRARFESDGTIGTHPGVTVRLMPRSGAPTVAASGPMIVDTYGIRVGGTPDAPEWTLPWSDLLSVSTEVGDQLFLRRRGASDRGLLFRLEVTPQSTYKWGCILQSWKRHFTPIT